MESKQVHLENGTPQLTPEFPGTPLGDRAAIWSLALVLGLVFLAYANTLGFQFVHDDDRIQILGNTWLRSWKYLPRYFTADVWAFEHPGFRGTFYRPIFLVWFRLQYVIFGLKPWGWHLCTVLCHVGVTALVYFTAARLLRDRLAALFTALIFGLHPTHAEGVAWVSGVTEPLFAFFLFASYLCYLKKRDEPERASFYLACSLGLFALASLSKETAVVLPFIIFACEMLWSRGGRDAPGDTRFSDAPRAFKVSAPYLVISALYMVARLLSLRGFQNTKEQHSYLSMILTWPSVLWFYVVHLMWPTRLSPFYTRVFYTQIDLHHVLLPAMAVLMVAAGL